MNKLTTYQILLVSAGALIVYLWVTRQQACSVSSTFTPLPGTQGTSMGPCGPGQNWDTNLGSCVNTPSAVLSGGNASCATLGLC
jgi:hypothetical protein